MLNHADRPCDGNDTLQGRVDAMCLMIAVAEVRKRLLGEGSDERQAARQVGGGEVWQMLMRASESWGGEGGGGEAYW
jgi:hypothetical protein